MLEVSQTRWAGHNPYITEANVRSIDLANGGSVGRGLARHTAPEFRPVSSYEAGRAPQFAAGGANTNGDPSAASPRRGLFRFLGGR